MNSSSRLYLSLLVLILAAFWLTRLSSLGGFPPFVDETIHIFSAEQVPQTGPLYNVGIFRQFTIWALTLFAPTASSDPIWLSRVVTLLLVMLGAAAIIGTARLLGSIQTALLAGLLLLFSNYHFFFERLALADPMSGAFTTLAVYFSARLRKRVKRRDAILCGFCLFIAFGAKTNALPFFIVPVLAALFLYQRPRAWISHARWLAWALGTALVLSGLLVLVLRLRGYDYLFGSLAFAIGGTRSASTETFRQLFDLATLLENIRVRWDMLVAYNSVFFAVAAVIALVTAVFTRHLYLLLCFLIPAFVLALSGVQETRYWVTPVATLIVLIALSAGIVTKRYPSAQLLIPILITAIGLAQSYQFWAYARTSPLLMPVFELDRREYIDSDAAGSGLDEVIAILEARQPALVLGALANCEGLRYRAWQRLPIVCLPMGPDGQDKAAIAAAASDPALPDRSYMVLETSPYAPETVPGTVVDVVTRPTNLATLTIYKLP